MNPIESFDVLARERFYLRLPKLLQLLGVSRSSVYLWMSNGTFPKPKRFGPRTVAWKFSDIEAWLDEKDNDTNCT